MTLVTIPPSLDVGCLVAEKYEIREVIGVGGFAIVFRAIELSVGRDVALKVLRPDDQGYGADRVARFMRESRVLASLQDPHTITMFDFGQTPDGYLYMVFEYVRGRDLAAVLEERGRLDEPTVRHIIRQLLHALREAHMAGVLHRDLKPENVLVYSYMGDSFRVKLIDFGIAKYLEPREGTLDQTITLTGRVVGTLLYMAPEQLLNAPLTPATDLYAVGLIAHELLAGAPAVSGRDTREKVVGQIKKDKVLPSEVDVSAGFRRIIDKMANRKPSDRYQSAQECLDALEAPEPAPENRPSLDTDARSRRMIIAAAVCLVIGVAAGAGLLLLLQPRTEGRMPRNDFVRVDSPPTASELAEAPAPEDTLAEPPPEASASDASHVAMGASDAENTAPLDDWRSEGCGREVQVSDQGFVSQRGKTSQGMQDWATFVGSRYRPSQPRPLIVMIPDKFRSGGQTARHTGMIPLAEEHDLLLTMPKIETLPVVTLADVAFIRDAIEQVKRTVCVDTRRIFAIGNGDSARVVENLACVTELTAIATVSYRGTARPWLCRTPRQIPHIDVSGTKDPFQPPQGGSNCVGVTMLSLDEREEIFREHHACGKKRSSFVRESTGTCWTWDCESTYVSCRVEGSHGWRHYDVRGETLGEYLFGKNCPEEATEFPTGLTILRFFFAQAAENTLR